MRSLRFFWQYISFRKDLLVLMIAISAVVTAAELYIPWVIMKAIDAVVERQSIEELNNWAIQGVGLLIAFYFLHIVMIRVEAKLILTASYNLRRRLYAHVMNQALPFFQRHQTGEIIHRVVTDTDEFDEDAGDLFSDLPFDVLTVIGVSIFMAVLDWKLALVVISFMFINAAVTVYLGRPLLGIEKSIQATGARLISRFQESVSGIRTVKSFGNEDHELDRLDVDNREILKTEMREGRIESMMEPLADLLSLLGLILVVWYGGNLIIGGELTVGGLVAFIAYMEIISEPLEDIEGYYRDYISCRAMAERLQDLLDDDERIPDTGSETLAAKRWTIEADDVRFQHTGATGNVVDGVSFRVEPGEIVAIAGRNGAGKSTLFDLLLRFYDPNGGAIKVDDTDLREIQLQSWRNGVGVMSQEALLFHGSILENIAYGNPDASPDDIMRAAEDSGIAELAQKFPNGLETIVGERGTRVSGGERQSIALARLFLRQPQVLLLDEPTTHLDGEALRNTLDVIRRLTSERTTIMITHQPDTIRLADRVIFLEHGKIAAEGTHDELLESTRSYRALWKDHGGGRRRSERPRRRLLQPAAT